MIKTMKLVLALLCGFSFSAIGVAEEITGQRPITQGELAVSIATNLERQGIQLCGPEDGELNVWSAEQASEVLASATEGNPQIQAKIKSSDVIVGALVDGTEGKQTLIFAQNRFEKEPALVGKLVSEPHCNQPCNQKKCSNGKCATFVCMDECGNQCAACKSTCSSDSQCELIEVKLPEVCGGFPLEDIFKTNFRSVEELGIGDSLWTQ